ncbi:MAG TPA: Crp/Fnr family transcriptional regulator [Solirubrobacteraceae bacterium]|jgi:CRP-like cAMP-binding protein
MASAPTATGHLATALREHGTVRRFRRGEALFSEGDIADRVFLLESGWVIVRSAVVDGDDVVLGLRGPGEVLGELSVLDGKPRSATAIAIADLEAIITPADHLTRTLAGDPAANHELLVVIADRLREADRRRLEFATKDTLGRIATRLLELADRFGEPADDGLHIDLPLHQEDLASWCGASRESTVRAMRTLRRLGIVTTGRRAVVIHDEAGLRKAARGVA